MADNYCNCCGDNSPEYIIELNQQGAPGQRGEKGDEGYSPVIDFIANDNEIKFTSTNENNITSTPNLYDYVLKKDGTNAPNPIRFNNIFIKNNSIYTQSEDIDLGNTSNIYSYSANIYYKTITLKGNSPLLRNDHGDLRIIGQDSLSIEAVSGNISLANTIHITDNIPYVGTPETNNKIATIGDIPKVSDSKITISQGDVVKGSFTLNQSGDTTIELDTGITNPLKIEGATEDNPSGGTVTYGMELGLDSSNKVYLNRNSKFVKLGNISEVSDNIIKGNQIYAPIYKTARIVDNDVNRTLQFGYNENGEISIKSITTGGGGGIYHNIAPITTNITNYPIYLKKVTGISGLEGMYYITLNYDNDTLKVNGDNKLYADFTPINNSITTIEGNITEVAEGINQLEKTKNQNIFDINKFTIIGSPTITDDGIASGFSGANFLDIQNIGSLLQSATNWSIEIPVKFTNNTTRQEIFGGYTNTAPFSLIVRLWTDGKINVSINGITNAYNFSLLSNDVVSLNIDYLIKVEVKDNYCYFYLNGILQGSARQITEKVKFSDNLRLGRTNNASAFTGSIDLKQFSITTDDKKVFGGLMESTKPIYDKITTTNTTLSTFKADTTNNFSAVNSALNEKANLSDLANYVPLATYNALLARVEALEAEINGGNA